MAANQTEGYRFEQVCRHIVKGREERTHVKFKEK